MGYRVRVERPEQPALVQLDACAEDRPGLEGDLALSLPAGPQALRLAGGELVYRLGPGQWLVRASLAAEPEWQARLEAATRGRHAAATLVSDAYAVFRVAGADARAVLCQGVAIDLDASAFGTDAVTRCALAKTSAIVHCVEPGERYELLVDSAFERYVDRWLRAAAGEAIVLGPAAR